MCIRDSSADDRNKTADLNPIRNLLDKRQELSDQIEQMEQEKTAIEQQVKLQMQDAAYGTAPGYKVSWVSSCLLYTSPTPKICDTPAVHQ